MKSTSLHRHLHPVHWHGSMYVAVVAILLTSLKSSGEMLRALQALPVHADVVSSLHLRDAETHESHLLFSGARHASYGGL